MRTAARSAVDRATASEICTAEVSRHRGARAPAGVQRVPHGGQHFRRQIGAQRGEMPKRGVQSARGPGVRRVRHAIGRTVRLDVDVGPVRRRLEGVVGGPEPAGHAPEDPRAAGPLRDDPAVRGPEVAVAAGGPDRPVHPLVDSFDEGGHGAPGRRHRTPRAAHVLQRQDDVVCLCLQHEDHAVGADVGVRSVEHEEVREAGNGHAEVGVCAVAPALAQRRPPSPVTSICPR